MIELPIVKRLERTAAALEGSIAGTNAKQAAALIREMELALVEAVRIIRKHVPIEALGMNSMGDGDIPGHLMSWPVLEEHLHYMDAALKQAREA